MWLPQALEAQLTLLLCVMDQLGLAEQGRLVAEVRVWRQLSCAQSHPHLHLQQQWMLWLPKAHCLRQVLCLQQVQQVPRSQVL